MDARETRSRANVSLHDVKPSSSLILCYVLAGCLSWTTGDEAQEHRAHQLGGQSFSYTATTSKGTSGGERRPPVLKWSERTGDENREIFRGSVQFLESRASQVDEHKEGSQKYPWSHQIEGMEGPGSDSTHSSRYGLRMAVRWIGNRKSTGKARDLLGQNARCYFPVDPQKAETGTTRLGVDGVRGGPVDARPCVDEERKKMYVMSGRGLGENGGQGPFAASLTMNKQLPSFSGTFHWHDGAAPWG
ncbi:hypothetical protein MCOR34_008973 [Pyricularia oryzae]|nr:hypothetical protein MCOR34_008973 [Pyricularia oryzae]KAI6450727.1 hypothetical protein MCOR17_009836 [Pyricularia oryzae]KAI6580423.1 hypothetical protein MCOR04_005723 [Pyricularia oryzae]